MCGRGTCTCGCGQSRPSGRSAAFDDFEELDQLDTLQGIDTLDELDDVADWAESDVLEEESLNEVDWFSEENALTGRAGPGAGRLGFVLTCTNPQRRQRFGAALRLA